MARSEATKPSSWIATVRCAHLAMTKIKGATADGINGGGRRASSLLLRA
jgi:hypothetical protein